MRSVSALIFQVGKLYRLSPSPCNTMRGGKCAISCWDKVDVVECPNWFGRHFFLLVLIGISYHPPISGIPGAFPMEFEPEMPFGIGRG